MGEHRHPTDAPRRSTPAHVLRRRGFRMILTSVIAAPLLLIAAITTALSAGFCGDRISSEVESCEASAQGSGVFIGILLMLDLAMFVGGLVTRSLARSRSEPPAHRRSELAPLRHGTEGAKSTVAVMLAIACWILTVVARTSDGGWPFAAGAGLLVLIPTTLVVAWGAESTRRYDLDGRHSPRAVAAAAATLLCVLVLIVV